MAKSISKGTVKIGHGPGYEITKTKYPRGAKTLAVNFDDGYKVKTTTTGSPRSASKTKKK